MHKASDGSTVGLSGQAATAAKWLRYYFGPYGPIEGRQAADLLDAYATQETDEPMNLRLFEAEGSYFIRGLGYGGNGSTPESAMREWVRHRNSGESQSWPVEKLVTQRDGRRRGISILPTLW